jgi:hypothetical protein
MSPHTAAAKVLSLTMSANAQEREPEPAQPQTDQADTSPNVPPPRKPDRVFGVLPNYGTVEDATLAGHSPENAPPLTSHPSICIRRG